MTPQDVDRAVAKILAMSGDDEAAHSEEDQLHVAVLEAIRDGADDAPGLAAAALATLQLDFCRWCA